jgi:hypothetical protein
MPDESVAVVGSEVVAEVHGRLTVPPDADRLSRFG